MSSSFIRPPDEINTEDEALAAVLEFAECHGLLFEDVLRQFRSRNRLPSDTSRSGRIREVLWEARQKAT